MSPPEKRKEKSPVPPVAGERTWTIRICPECGEASRYDHWMHAPDCVAQPGWEESAVEVVELSRLRAAEEERDKLRELAEAGYGGGVRDTHTAQISLIEEWKAERERFAGLLRNVLTMGIIYRGQWKLTEPVNHRFLVAAREALASLEQKED